MSYITQQEKIKKLLLLAVQPYGSQNAFTGKIGMNRYQYNRCINGVEEMPLNYAIIIQKETKGRIRAKDIAPSRYKRALDIIEDWSSRAECHSTYLIPTNLIDTAENKLPRNQKASEYYFDRAIILDDLQNDFFNLVTGRNSFDEQKNYGARKVQAKVFSFTKIFKDNGANFQKFIKENKLFISEKTEIGLYIEGVIGERRGRKKILKEKLEIPQNSAEFKFTGDTRNFLCKILELGCHYTYCEAKKVLNKGSALLIEAMDRKIITISKAATMVKLSQEEQFEIIEQTIQKKKLAIEPEFFNHWRFLCQ
jgi:DNA-binding transcriptional regulator YdaS (Cro superfamily)